MGKRGWIKDDSIIIEFAQQQEEILNKGVYKNLMFQVNKIAKHAKGASLTSQRQYYNHMDHFVRFLADNYGVKNLKNISGKHVAAYIEDRQNEEKSAATVKNDLAAIRYYHNQMVHTKYHLPSNDKLKEDFNISLERRKFGGINRRWTETEYHKMLNIADAHQRPEIARILQLGREQGLRIHEVVKLSRADAEKAIRTGELTVKGKGGLIRSIPLQSHVKPILVAAMREVQRGEKLFVSKERKAHEVIQSVQGFIQNHRSKVVEPGLRSKGIPLTMHGLRHSYAYEQYQKALQTGKNSQDAKLSVSKLIGHSREDVTQIYLAE